MHSFNYNLIDLFKFIGNIRLAKYVDLSISNQSKIRSGKNDFFHLFRFEFIDVGKGSYLRKIIKA